VRFVRRQDRSLRQPSLRTLIVKKKTSRKAVLAAFENLTRAGYSAKQADAIACAIMAALHVYDKGQRSHAKPIATEGL
jgi:hypothetical protein